MNSIPVIYYHSVAPQKNKLWYKNYLTLELDYFEDLLKYLNQEKFKFLTMDEYMDKRSDKNFKDKAVCLNFDDGCLDNYVYAFPLLEKYNAKATIFVNPDFVPDKPALRPTLKEVWSGKCRMEELEELGFCSWDEMRYMESSGCVDIQSHTLTHTKHYYNDRIKDFHHPKSNYLYPIGNRFPEMKPDYITDSTFKTKLAYGTPFFEEKSSVLVKRVWINPEFEEACVNELKDQDWLNYNKQHCIQRVEGIYQQFVKENKLIVRVETEEEYQQRVWDEVNVSRKVIGEKLGKVVEYCCWPHGDHNELAHLMALKCGYRASTVVLEHGQDNLDPSRFDRIGHANVKNSRFFTLLKMKYKISLYRGNAFFKLIDKLYFKVKYGK